MKIHVHPLQKRETKLNVASVRIFRKDATNNFTQFWTCILLNLWDQNNAKETCQGFSNLAYKQTNETALVYKDSSMRGRKQKNVLNYPGHYLSGTVVEKAAF